MKILCIMCVKLINLLESRFKDLVRKIFFLINNFVVNDIGCFEIRFRLDIERINED